MLDFATTLSVVVVNSLQTDLLSAVNDILFLEIEKDIFNIFGLGVCYKKYKLNIKG